MNILTNHAVNNRAISVFGGRQMRPNIHIDDMTDLYVQSLQWPAEMIDGRTYNAGYYNHRVEEIAGIVQRVVGPDVRIETTHSDDKRSYHISSARLKRDLGFEAKRGIENAVEDLVAAFDASLVPDSMDSDRYYNIRRMKTVNLS